MIVVAQHSRIALNEAVFGALRPFFWFVGADVAAAAAVAAGFAVSIVIHVRFLSLCIGTKIERCR